MDAGELFDRELDPEEYICLQGQKSEYFYVLLEGELEILLTDEVFLKDHESDLTMIESINRNGRIIGSINQPWTHFGEMCHLLNSTANSSIRAKSRSKVRYIPSNQEPFNQYVTKNPALGFRIAINLSCQIYQALISIQKIQRTLNSTQTYLNQLQESCKSSLLEIINALESVGEGNLNVIHKLLGEKIMQDMLSSESSYDSARSLVITSRRSLESGDSIFKTSKIIKKSPGEALKLQTDDADFLYILKSGEIGIYKNDVCGQVRSQPGDIFGGIQTFSSLGMSIRHLQYTNYELRPIIPSELICLSNADIRDEVQDHPELILYINYALAEFLKNIELELQTFWKYEDRFLKLLGREEGSWQEFIRATLAVFIDNQTWFLECMDHVFNLKRALNTTETNFLKFSQDAKSNYINPFLTGNQSLI